MLPSDIYVHICSYLDIKSRVPAILVSKVIYASALEYVGSQDNILSTIIKIHDINADERIYTDNFGKIFRGPKNADPRNLHFVRDANIISENPDSDFNNLPYVRRLTILLNAKFSTIRFDKLNHNIAYVKIISINCYLAGEHSQYNLTGFKNQFKLIRNNISKVNILDEVTAVQQQNNIRINGFTIRKMILEKIILK